MFDDRDANEVVDVDRIYMNSWTYWDWERL